jgi:hypothetical protein
MYCLHVLFTVSLAEIVYLVDKHRLLISVHDELKAARVDPDYVIAGAAFTADVIEAMRHIPRLSCSMRQIALWRLPRSIGACPGSVEMAAYRPQTTGHCGNANARKPSIRRRPNFGTAAQVSDASLPGHIPRTSIKSLGRQIALVLAFQPRGHAVWF